MELDGEGAISLEETNQNYSFVCPLDYTKWVNRPPKNRVKVYHSFTITLDHIYPYTTLDKDYVAPDQWLCAHGQSFLFIFAIKVQDIIP